MSEERLKVIPFFTGAKTLEEAIKDRKGVKLLWLEILVNGDINWEDYHKEEQVKIAYEKACIWYTNFRSMIQAYTGRPPLETKRGKIDEREYRRLIEVLNFVTR